MIYWSLALGVPRQFGGRQLNVGKSLAVYDELPMCAGTPWPTSRRTHVYNYVEDVCWNTSIPDTTRSDAAAEAVRTVTAWVQ